MYTVTDPPRLGADLQRVYMRAMAIGPLCVDGERSLGSELPWSDQPEGLGTNDVARVQAGSCASGCCLAFHERCFNHVRFIDKGRERERGRMQGVMLGSLSRCAWEWSGEWIWAEQPNVPGQNKSSVPHQAIIPRVPRQVTSTMIETSLYGTRLHWVAKYHPHCVDRIQVSTSQQQQLDS